MGGISNQSPAVLKKSSGAANVKMADGQTIEEWKAGVSASFSSVGDEIATLMPKSGGQFTDIVGFDESIYLKSGKALYGQNSALNQYYKIVLIDGADTFLLNPDLVPSNLAVYVHGSYTGYLNNDSYNALSWTSAGVKLNAGARVNGISTDGTLSGNADDILVTQKAIKTYVDSQNAAQVLGAKVFIAEAEVSGVTAAINFDDLPLSDYDQFEVEIFHAEGFTSGSNLEFRFRDGSVTADDTKYNKSGAGATLYSSVKIGDAVTSTGGNGAGTCLTVTVKFVNEASSSSSSSCVSSVGLTQAAQNGAVTSVNYSGSYASLSYTPDGFQFFANTGNLIKGVFRLYGVKKS